MKARPMAAPTSSSFKKNFLTIAPKSARGKSRPMPLVVASSPPLVIAVSKPRNPIAVDALLKKSGAHEDRRRAQKLRAREQLQNGLDEVRKKNAND